MMLTEFYEYLRTLLAASDLDVTETYLGKIVNNKDKVIGVYPDSLWRRMEAIGKCSTYTYIGFKILVHWTKNAKDTDNAAEQIYGIIEGINEVYTDNYYIAFMDLDYEHPVFVGTDDKGVYEYVITGKICLGR